MLSHTFILDMFNLISDSLDCCRRQCCSETVRFRTNNHYSDCKDHIESLITIVVVCLCDVADTHATLLRHVAVVIVEDSV